MPKIPLSPSEWPTKPKSKNRRKRKDRTPEYKRAKAARKRANRLERLGSSRKVAQAKVRMNRYGLHGLHQKIYLTNRLHETLARKAKGQGSQEDEKEILAAAELLGYQGIPTLEHVDADLRRLLDPNEPGRVRLRLERALAFRQPAAEKESV